MSETMIDPDPRAIVRAWNRLILAGEKVALKSLATGNFAWFGIFAIAAVCAYRLSPSDLKEVMLKVLVTYGWTGYVVAAVTIFVSIKILKWRENFYHQEIARIAEVRNAVVQNKLELPLQSSVQTIVRK